MPIGSDFDEFLKAQAGLRRLHCAGPQARTSLANRRRR